MRHPVTRRPLAAATGRHGGRTSRTRKRYVEPLVGIVLEVHEIGRIDSSDENEFSHSSHWDSLKWCLPTPETVWAESASIYKMIYKNQTASLTFVASVLSGRNTLLRTSASCSDVRHQSNRIYSHYYFCSEKVRHREAQWGAVQWSRSNHPRVQLVCWKS